MADRIVTLFLGRVAAEVMSADPTQTQVVELITSGRSGDIGLAAGRTGTGLTPWPRPHLPPQAPSQAIADFGRRSRAVLTWRRPLKAYAQRLRGGQLGAVPAVLGFIVLFIFFSVAAHDANFLSAGNFANLLTQAAPIMLIGIGMVFVLLLGEIDLSAGAAGGVAAATMGIAISNGGDLKQHLGNPTFYSLVLFMVITALIAVWYRLWIALAFIVVGLILMFTTLAQNAVLGILLAVCVGVAIGVLTGILVAKIGIPSFVVTLALFLGWQGVLLQLIGQGASINVGQNEFLFKLESATNAIPPVWGWIMWVVGAGGFLAFTVWRSIHNRSRGLVADPLSVVLLRGGVIAVVTGLAVWLLNQNRSLNRFITQEGVPRIVPLLLVLLLLWTLVLAKTRFGRYIYAVGGNAEAARRAGVDVVRIRMSAFVICSGMAGLAGVVAAARTAYRRHVRWR